MDVRRILVALLPALTLTLVLAACGGGSSSTADPTPSFSDPPSSSTPPDPPKREPIGDFARRWVAAQNRMLATGDGSSYLALNRGCAGCAKVAAYITKIHRAGGHIETAGWTVKRVEVNGRNIDIYVHNAPTTYTEMANGPVKHLSGGAAHFQVRAVRQGTSWRITSLVQVSS